MNKIIEIHGDKSISGYIWLDYVNFGTLEYIYLYIAINQMSQVLEDINH